MPVLIALIAAVTAMVAFAPRARNAANATRGLPAMASDMRRDGRRAGSRRNSDPHPAGSAEDPAIAIAIAAIASGRPDPDGPPGSEQPTALIAAMRETVSVSAVDADTPAIPGRWMAVEGGRPDAAMSRLSRKLMRNWRPARFASRLTIPNATLTAGAPALNAQKKEALDDVKRAFRFI